SSSEKEEKLSSENWLDDDFIDANFIENALGLSDEEISFIDKTPLPFERLSGADELNSQALNIKAELPNNDSPSKAPPIPKLSPKNLDKNSLKEKFQNKKKNLQ